MKSALTVLAIAVAFAPAAQAAPNRHNAGTARGTAHVVKKHHPVKAKASALVCRTRTWAC